MGLYDEAELQLRQALGDWDFSPVFPPNYAGDKTVAVVPGWPSDLIDNILAGTQLQGQMARVVVSVQLVDAQDTHRSLGDRFGPGNAGTVRYGTRAEVTYLASCWADQQMGGGDTTRKLAGQVQACCFYNKMRLPALRALRCHSSQEAYEDRSQYWRFDVTIEGSAVVTYDA